MARLRYPFAQMLADVRLAPLPFYCWQFTWLTWAQAIAVLCLLDQLVVVRLLRVLAPDDGAGNDASFTKRE